VTESRSATVLVVSPDAIGGSVAALEKHHSLSVHAVTDPSVVPERIEEADCVVAVDGTGIDVLDVLEAVRERDDEQPVVVVSDDETVASRAVEADVSELVPRTTADADERLLDRVRATLERQPPIRADGAARMPIEDLDSRAERRLKQRAIDEAPIGITIADATRSDEPLVYINDAFEQLTGYSKERAIGRNCRFLQGEDSDPEAVAKMRAAIAAEEPVSVELKNYQKDGEPFWNRVDIAPITDLDGEVSHFVGFQTDITDRKRAEMEIEQQRRELERLLVRIDGILSDVTEALVGAKTRAEIQQAVCESVTSADTYGFAWIGVPDRSAETLVSDASAGWAVSNAALEVDLGATDQLPAAAAYTTGESQVVTDEAALSELADRAPWLSGRGVRGIIAVPLVYNETTYGVLSLHAIEEDALNEHEQVVIEAVGRSTATALNALERGRMIATDSVTEIEIETRDTDLFFVDLAARGECSLTYTGSVYRDDGAVLMFFRADEDAETMLAAAEQCDDVASVEVIHEQGGDSLLEFTITDDSLPVTLAARGVRLHAIEAVDGVASVELELPSESDARAIIDLFLEQYPESDIVAHRERERPPSTRQAFVADVKDRLTQRQLTALQKAHVSGFYRQDRPVTGDVLAESMGIGRATYHQHLRAAERKLVEAFFGQASLPSEDVD
jgi:PAS domain S-box-containing protein